MGLFKYYVTQRMWVGGLPNVTSPIEFEKFYSTKALLVVGGWQTLSTSDLMKSYRPKTVCISLMKIHEISIGFKPI